MSLSLSLSLSFFLSCTSHETLSRLPSVFDTVTLYNHLHFVLTVFMDMISNQVHAPLYFLLIHLAESLKKLIIFLEVMEPEITCPATVLPSFESQVVHLLLTLNRLNIFETGINL